MYCHIDIFLYHVQYSNSETLNTRTPPLSWDIPCVMLDQTMRELLQKWDPNDLAAELMQAAVSVSPAVRASQGFGFWGSGV